MESRKLTVMVNKDVLTEWNAARKRRGGITQKQVLESMMTEWCYPERFVRPAAEPRKFVWPDLLKGVSRGTR